MTNPKKQYVFDILVKDKSDVLQLLTYAMYCRSKNETANKLHAEGKSQLEIEEELKHYHEMIAKNERLRHLMHLEAEAAHTKYTTKIEQKTVKEFIKKIQTSPDNKTSKTKWVMGKVADAVAGIAATITVIVLFVGGTSLFVDKEKRDAMFAAGTQEAEGLMKGEIPVLDKYRAIMAKKENDKKLVAEQTKIKDIE